jgi:hypothetical protein
MLLAQYLTIDDRPAHLLTVTSNASPRSLHLSSDKIQYLGTSSTFY